MNEQKEMTVVKTSLPQRFRYWTTPPEAITIRITDIEPFVPKANWKASPSADQTVDIPAEKVLSKNVPRISLRALAELLPELISASDGVVKLPVSKLAVSYRLVQHEEELIPEPEPEPPFVPETPVVMANGPEKPDGPDDGGPAPLRKPEDAEVRSGEEASKVSPPPRLGLKLRPFRGDVSVPAEDFAKQGDTAAPPKGDLPPPTPKEIPPPATDIQPPSSPADPAPIAGFPKPENPPAPPPVVPAPPSDPTKVTSSKFPPRRTGSFVGLPIFRRKTPVIPPPEAPVPPEIAPPPIEPVEPVQEDVEERKNVVKLEVLPPLEPVPEVGGPETPPEIPSSAPQAVESAGEAVAATPETPQEEPGLRLPIVVEPVEPESVEPVEPVIPVKPVRMLRTEAVSPGDQNQEIVEQEPLQALFLTEEIMTVSRVIELCGGLPGINSCVLAHGTLVVASHNVPDSVDLVSMSAHAANMLKAMRDSSARMGVGAVPAVTLHTEKGVISFFNREDLTMLVFHKDRGFVPGVREKMAAVLGELAKARLTLPVGDEEAG